MNRITAIITVYFPKDEHVNNIEIISKQVDRVIVCDNSNNNNAQLFIKFGNLKYYGFEQNLGLSVAFNKVLRYTSNNWNDSDFVIFFDQDSTIPNNHITKLYDCYQELVAMGHKVGCIGPVFYNLSMGKTDLPSNYEKINDHIIKIVETIGSSMLCRYQDIESVGFWNEGLFLDMIDWDLCWRLGEKVFSCYMSYDTVMEHAVGEGKKRILFYDIGFSNPIREYYQTRDCLYLLKENYIPVKFIFRFLIRLFNRPFVHILFLDSPLIRAKFIFRGMWDYFRNLHGEYK